MPTASPRSITAAALSCSAARVGVGLIRRACRRSIVSSAKPWTTASITAGHSGSSGDVLDPDLVPALLHGQAQGSQAQRLAGGLLLALTQARHIAHGRRLAN